MEGRRGPDKLYRSDRQESIWCKRGVFTDWVGLSSNFELNSERRHE